MKLSKFLKQYIDALVKEYNDCEMNDLTEEQKEVLMLQIHRVSLMIIEKLSEE